MAARDFPFSRSLAPSALVAATLALLAPSGALGQEIGYLLEPAAGLVRWDDGLGLEDEWLWGGSVGLTFGDAVRLHPFWYQRDGVTADPATIESDEPLFPGVGSFGTDVRHVGANLEVDLTGGAFVPFVRLGGGVIRLDPAREGEAGDEIDRITVQYGGGLRFPVGRAGLSLWGHGLAFRLDRGRLYAPAEPPAEGETEDEWRSLTGGASLRIPLGTRAPSPEAGIGGTTTSLQAYAGELRLSDELAGTDQRLVGARLGLGLNRLVSVGAFYWQGTNDDFDATVDLRAYGGEARFRLSGGSGLAPFVVAGAGRLDYDGDAAEEAGEFADREDRTALILGGGVALRLSERVDLDVAARNWLMSPAGELQDIEESGDLTSNWLYSAGLSVRLGGERAADRRDREATRLEEERAEIEEARAELERERRAMVAGAELRGRAPAEGAIGDVRVDTVTVVGPDGEERRVVQAIPAPTAGPRQIVIPVLEEGTIVLRFGPEAGTVAAVTAPQPAAPSIDRAELRSLIRGELEAAAAVEQADATALDSLERRIVDRLEARLSARMEALEEEAREPRTELPEELVERLERIERRLDRRIEALEARPPAATPEPRVSEPEEPAPDAPEAGEPGDRAVDRLRGLDPDRTLPYAGLGFGEGTQLVLGARFDFGPLDPGSSFELHPEIALGVGEGDPTVLLLANVRWAFGRTGRGRNLRPYLIGGAGVFSPTALAIGTGAGVEFDLGGGDDVPLRAFAEIQGLNLFDRTRLLFGATLWR